MGALCPNAEGEDQLWLHAMEEASHGTNFLASISDTDSKEAALVILPRLIFADDGTAVRAPVASLSPVCRSRVSTDRAILVLERDGEGGGHTPGPL
mgnify:CR=1 FL=1